MIDNGQVYTVKFYNHFYGVIFSSNMALTQVSNENNFNIQIDGGRTNLYVFNIFEKQKMFNNAYMA